MKKASTYIALLITAVLMSFIHPKQSRFEYEYSTGHPWQYETLIAPLDFPILKSDAEIMIEKEKKSSEVVSCFIYNEDIAGSRIRTFENLAEQQSIDSIAANLILNDLNSFYEAGIVPGGENVPNSGMILVKRGKRMVETPVSNICQVQDALDIIKEDVIALVGLDAAREVFTLCRLESYVLPNLTYDEATTALFHKEAVDYVSPTKGMVYAGQLIVSNGELITPDIAQLLDSYKAEYESVHGTNTVTWKYMLSHILCVIMFLGFVCVLIYFSDRSIFEDIRKLAFILTLFLISFSSIMIGINSGDMWLFLFPYASLAIYMESFFKTRVAMALYIAMILHLLMAPAYGYVLFYCNLTAGFVVLLTSSWLNRGLMQFLNSIFAFLAMAVIILTFWLSDPSLDWQTVRMCLIMVAFNSVLIVVCYPFMFIFEKIFSQLSEAHVWLLSDTNNKLLTKLARVAPGTFQHSMQVANLTEAAVRELGGNAMLAKVGALYHDIGKIDNPQCFVENQISGNDEFHGNLSPEESATQIIRHVDDGLAMALKHSLPEMVTDFIRTHHGHTQTGYFYAKYCNDGGDPANTAPFTYHTGLPKTMEQAVLMLADSIEAASRSMKDHTPERISALVDGIINDKLKTHQFDEADITMMQIEQMRSFFKTQLQQIYHVRIAYPKNRKV